MKHVIFTFSTLLLICLSAFSQKFELGIKGGTDIVKMNGLAFNQEFEFGYHAGAFAHIPFSKKIGLQPEVYYSEVSLRKSADGSLNAIYNNTNIDELSNIRFGKIHVPLLAYVNVSKKVAFQLGPKFSLVSSANLKNTGTEISNAVKQGELSAVAGIRISLMSFRIFARYEVGLNDIGDVTNDAKWTSQSIHAGIGIRVF
ncbi:MAG: porin family protein [Ferruginibacter sp.]